MISVNHNMKFANFCPQYLEIKKDVLAPRIWADYSRTIDKLLIPLLGHIKLTDQKPAHVQQFIQYLQGDVRQKKDGTLDTDNPKLSQATIRRKLTVLQHRKFHSLRHTSATLFLYGGVNLKQVQARLGHGDISTTNKYLHCIQEADEQAAEVLGSMLITRTECRREEKQA